MKSSACAASVSAEEELKVSECIGVLLGEIAGLYFSSKTTNKDTYE